MKASFSGPAHALWSGPGRSIVSGCVLSWDSCNTEPQQGEAGSCLSIYISLHSNNTELWTSQVQQDLTLTQPQTITRLCSGWFTDYYSNILQLLFLSFASYLKVYLYLRYSKVYRRVVADFIHCFFSPYIQLLDEFSLVITYFFCILNT